jgi:hypothetical protein
MIEGNHYKATDLLQTRGGLFGSATTQRLAADEPQFLHSNVGLGNLARIWPNAIAQSLSQITVRAGGSGLDVESALARAIGEGLERYAAGCFYDEQLVFGSAAHMTEPSLDIEKSLAAARRSLPIRSVLLSLRTSQNRFAGLEEYPLQTIRLRCCPR